VVFKRRNPRSVWDWTRQLVYPAGGFLRAIQYVRLRLTRLPDEPHRIARGVFAGVFVSFTPFFGIHFILGGLLGWLIRGNVLAALLATFIGNPLTTPFIAITSVEFGHWMLGIDAPLSVLSIVAAFTNAGTELWQNARAVFTDDVAQWASLRRFFDTIYLPYLVGGILPGLVAGLLCYWATIPIVRAYQRLRAGKLAERIARRQAARDGRSGPEAAAEAAAEAALPGDDGPPAPR
jgi:hypothetical protein